MSGLIPVNRLMLFFPVLSELCQWPDLSPTVPVRLISANIQLHCWILIQYILKFPMQETPGRTRFESFHMEKRGMEERKSIFTGSEDAAVIAYRQEA